MEQTISRSLNHSSRFLGSEFLHLIGLSHTSLIEEGIISKPGRELNQTLGDAVYEAIPNIQVKMKPDIRLRVEIEKRPISLMNLIAGDCQSARKACSCCRVRTMVGYLALKRGVSRRFHFASPHQVR